MNLAPDIETPSKDQATDQQDRIDAREWDWLIWYDGGRYDYFAELIPEYLDGDLQAVWNHDIGYTGDWCVEMLTQEFDDMGIFSPVPLHALGGVDYDDTEWFDVHPNYREYDASDVSDRLAALGYKEHTEDTDDDMWTNHGDKVNSVFLDHVDQVDGGIIRYLHPHPPYEGLPVTKGSGKVTRTAKAVRQGDLDFEQLHEAYEREFREGLDALMEILDVLDGTVVITADHGECLGDCNQFFHSRSLDKHDHLTVVPWFEVDASEVGE